MATDIVLRSVKAASLTHAEMDQNWESLAQTVDAVTANVTVAVTDQNKILEVSISTGTITLPTVANALGTDTDSFQVTIKNINSTTLIVDGNGAELIEGVSSINLAQFASVVVTLDAAGTGWTVIASADTYAIAKTDGNFIVGDGTNWVAENGSTVRDSLGLGVASSVTFAALTITGLSALGALTVTGAFTSLGIDDNATSTAMTIDASENTTFAGDVTADTFIVTSGTGTYQAGSLGYTDPNWGFIYRPPQAGGTGAHLFENNAGTDILSLAEDLASIFYGSISLPDNKKLAVGAADDLFIRHNGTNSTIENNTGNLIIAELVNSGTISLQSKNSAGTVKDGIVIGAATPNVSLYYDGLVVMTTVSNGVNFADNKHLYLGTSNDLDIYHSGTGTEIVNNTGVLAIRNFTTSGLVFLTSKDSGGVDLASLSYGGTTPNLKLYYNDTVVASTQSGGIAFNADTAAANTLDDYEEGLWTPVFSDGTDNANSYSVQIGTYEKIGRQVTVRLQVGTSNITDVSGAVRFTGLPYTANSTTSTEGSASVSFASGLNLAAGASLSGYIPPNTTYIQLTVWDATTGTTSLDAAEWSTNGRCILSAVYYV